MINTLQPGGKPGHSEQKGEILDRISKQYGAEEKNRDPVKKLGKDEFFKIMVTQMQHQDPMKPMENEQMAAQMAQFSSLEQMLNVNQNIEKLTQAQLPLQQLGAASLIGKFVTADSSRILHTEGKPTELKFDLQKDAKHLRVTVINEKGEGVREFELHDLQKGPNKVVWDGKKSNTLSAGSGQFMIQVAGEDETGKPMQVSMTKTEMVNGVGFDGKETTLYTGDPKNPHKMLLKNVTRIVDPSQANNTAGGAAAPPENPFQAMLAAQGLIPQADQGEAAAANPYEMTEAEPSLADLARAGQAAKYTPYAAPGAEEAAIKKAQNEMQRQMKMEQEMNPAAIMASQGKLSTRGEEIDDANPAAKQFASADQLAKRSTESRNAVNLADIPEIDGSSNDNSTTRGNSASGNSMPSSEDGSVAGKWSE